MICPKCSGDMYGPTYNAALNKLTYTCYRCGFRQHKEPCDSRRSPRRIQRRSRVIARGRDHVGKAQHDRTDDALLRKADRQAGLL